MQEECPTIYFSLAQRHLDWLQACHKARAPLRVAAETLEDYPLDDRPLYAFPDVRAAWSVLSDTQRRLFDQGYVVRFIFSR